MKFKPSLIAGLIVLLAVRVPGFQPPQRFPGIQRFSRPARQNLIESRAVTPKGTPINAPSQFGDPPDFSLPEIPFPDDPADPFSDPFDPINDFPLPELPDIPPE